MVSIVLAAYKSDFLDQAIRSILAQTYRKFDLTIVNDCSPEDLDKIVSPYLADNRVRYVKLGVNRGGANLAFHWNQCMDFATGELVVFASDDDYYEPTYLSEMVAISQKYPQINLFHCRIRYVDSNGETLLLSQPALEFETGIEFAYQRMLFRRKQALQEFMFRRKAFVEMGGFVEFPKAWYTDDATWNKLGQNGVVYVGKTLFNFRMSGQNISSEDNSILEKLNAVKSYMDWMEGFLKTVKPESDDDKFMLKVITGEYRGILRSDYIQLLRVLPIKSFIAGFKTAYKKRMLPLKTLLHISIIKLIK